MKEGFNFLYVAQQFPLLQAKIETDLFFLCHMHYLNFPVKNKSASIFIFIPGSTKRAHNYKKLQLLKGIRFAAGPVEAY